MGTALRENSISTVRMGTGRNNRVMNEVALRAEPHETGEGQKVRRQHRARMTAKGTQRWVATDGGFGERMKTHYCRAKTKAGKACKAVAVKRGLCAFHADPKRAAQPIQAGIPGTGGDIGYGARTRFGSLFLMFRSLALRQPRIESRSSGSGKVETLSALVSIRSG